MKRILLSLVLGVLAASPAHAANLAVVAQPPTMLNIVVLLVAVVAAIASFKVLSLVKGGLMGKPWQFFIAGFGVLALSQVVALLGAVEVVAIPEFVVPAMLIAMGALFTWGVFETKRTLG